MIQSKQMWVEKIDTLSKELKLPKIRQDFEEIIKESIQLTLVMKNFSTIASNRTRCTARISKI